MMNVVLRILLIPAALLLVGTWGSGQARAQQATCCDSYKKAGDIDDTAALNRALATQQTVQLPHDHTFQVSSPIIIHSGQTLSGGPSTWIVAASSWVGHSGMSEAAGQVIHNEHFDAQSLTDSNITIHGISIDGTQLTQPSNGRYHGIGIRMASSVLVYNVTCKNIGDCTAFQADDHTIVRDSSASGITNVGFDHWAGPRNALAQHNTIVCAPGGRGVMFTGTTTQDQDAQGSNTASVGNHVSGPCAGGIVFNTLSAGSVLTNVSSSGDTFDAQGASSIGIDMQGDIRNGTINQATISNTTAPAFFLRPERYAGGIKVPSGISITGPVLINDSSTASSSAPFVVFGNNHKIINSDVEGGSYDFLLRTNDPSLAVQGGAHKGAKGLVKLETLQ